MRTLPGAPAPLGARLRTDDGAPAADFAVFSEHATRIEVCLFDAAGAETARVPLPERSGDVWHGRIPGLQPGQHYGLRAHGPWAPDAGHRFNPAKLLVDPYARALSGPVVWNEALRGARATRPAEPDARDTARWMPKAVLLDDAFDWEGDAPPRTPWSRSVVYEAHVKGMTQRHPGVPEADRGRYLGLVAEPVIEHLLALGVTAVELLPVQHHAVDSHLAALGLPNYWGYMTLGFFAPDVRYAQREPVREFREMVKRLHRAGLEVILDVVYNHTPEGGHDGPTLSLRGLDNASYYRLRPDAPGEYLDFTGCGNSLATGHPRALQLVLDSLRYWVAEMHVDGFRFDLAPVLARDSDQFQPFGRFFELIRQDPVLAGVKLVAEPWDLGPGGWQLGRFPAGWSEWNDRFRDATRRFWRGDGGQLPELASRLAGSSDFFDAGGRAPQASVNFVAAHDGMTLRDLATYAHKHNEANGEGNRDGGHDESHNWGVEGESGSLRVRKLRERACRNLFATVALAQGVPMIAHGDELGRTQRGNNNAYCQDNELTWVDWEGADQEMLAFARRVLALRRDNALFRRRRFFDGAAPAPGEPPDVAWLRPDGAPMQEADWHDPARRELALWIPAAAADATDEAGRPQAAADVLLLLNGGPRTHAFTLVEPPGGASWRELLNTACDGGGRCFASGARVPVAPHGLVVLALEGPG